jgi:hypothetical protein
VKGHHAVGKGEQGVRRSGRGGAVKESMMGHGMGGTLLWFKVVVPWWWCASAWQHLGELQLL